MASSTKNSNKKKGDDFPSMILSAGLGERFRPYSTVLPKPSIPFLNIPFLNYSVHLAETLGTSQIVFNTHHLPQKIRETAAAIPQTKSDYAFLDEQPKILGSAGGIRNARNLLHGRGSFLALNADSVCLFDNMKFFEDMRKIVRDKKTLAVFALVPHENVGTLYNAVWINDKNEIVDIGKTAPEGRKDLRGLHFTGVQCLSDEIFEIIPDKPCDIFRDVLLPKIKSGVKVYGYATGGLWYEGGSLKGYLEDTAKLLAKLEGLTDKELKTFNGNDYLHGLFKRFSPTSDKVKSGVFKGRDVKIDPSAKLQGKVVLGHNVEIGADCVLKDCVVNSEIKIKAGSKITADLILK